MPAPCSHAPPLLRSRTIELTQFPKGVCCLMSEIVNLAFVGCGGIMGAHEQGFRQLWEKDLRTFRVRACCDIDEGRANAMADLIAKWQGDRPAVYTHLDDLLANKDKDELHAADITVVHREHHTVAVPCLDAGLHVTIEKPIGITIRAGQQIIEAAKRNNRKLQVAENYRRSPGERAANWAIRSGRIGELRQVYWIDVGERLWHWGWRDDLEVAGGGWSMDGGVHFADLFRYHIGEVKTLYAISKAYHPFRYGKSDAMEDPIPATTEDTTMAVLTFDGGVTGTWCSTMAAPGSRIGGRALYGSEGCIDWQKGLVMRKTETVFDDLIAEHRKTVGEDAYEQMFPRGVTDTFATELYEFVEAVRGNAEIEITGEEGLKDEAISLAIYESELSGQPVEVEKVYTGEIAEKQRQFDEPLGLR